jgi:fatty-acyl-CoA synthase
MVLTTSYWPARDGHQVRESTVGGLLADAAADAPDTVALVEGIADPGRRRWTYRQLLDEATAVAHGLAARVAPGERVAIWAANSPEWLLVELGAALAGVTLVTVNPALTATEARYAFEQSRCRLILHDDEFRGASLSDIVAGVAPDLPDLALTMPLTSLDELVAAGDASVPLAAVSPDDAVQLQYTSGTTGVPKGALLRHRGVTNVARLTFERAGIGPGSVYLTPLPLFHTAACCIGVLGPISVRGTLVLVSAFDPGVTLQLCDEEGADAFGAVPTVFLALLEHPELAARTQQVRTLIGGGAPVLTELIRRMERGFGASFINLYGQTELSPVVTMVLPGDAAEDKATTVGTPLPGVELQVVNPDDGALAPIGEQGELWARGFSTMIEYFDLPDATAATLTADGWLRTGDLGTMDDRGYVTITGRLKDVIIRGGENVYPREIEEVLMTHPDVADVAVVGAPDERWGEVVAAVVRPAGDQVPDVEALRDHCRQVLARHKVPTRWLLAAQFPLTGSGKVQKFALRAQIADGALVELEPAAARSEG